MTTPASASSNGAAPPAPGIFPLHPGPHGYFDYTISPRATTSGTIIVRNLTTSPAHYLIYAVAATTSPVGGVAYGQSQTNPQGIAAWMHLSAATVDLAPKASTPVTFTVAVPAGTSPGDYVTAIAAQTPTPTPASASSSSGGQKVQLLATTRVIVAVEIHVPGLIAPAGHFGPPSVSLQQHRRQVLTIPIVDTGNMLMKPYLAGNLSSCSGGPPVLSIARQLDTFVPHTSIDYPWYLNNQVLSAGCYKATLTLSLGAGGTHLASFNGTLQVKPATTQVQTTTPKGRFIVVHTSLPAWLVPAIAAGALLFLLAILLLLRSRAKDRQPIRRIVNEDRGNYGHTITTTLQNAPDVVGNAQDTVQEGQALTLEPLTFTPLDPSQREILEQSQLTDLRRLPESLPYPLIGVAQGHPANSEIKAKLNELLTQQRGLEHVAEWAIMGELDGVQVREFLHGAADSIDSVRALFGEREFLGQLPESLPYPQNEWVQVLLTNSEITAKLDELLTQRNELMYVAEWAIMGELDSVQVREFLLRAADSIDSVRSLFGESEITYSA